MTKEELSQQIKQEALRLGFGACGIAKANLLEKDAEYLQAWLDKGYHADMTYMANHFEKRTDPRLLVESAQSVIVVLLSYFPERTQEKHLPQIAKYAYGEDYHDFIKKRLKELFRFIQEQVPEKQVTGRMFTDSAPVLERKWAVEAGLGRIGKNTCLIHPQLGSFCFIAEIIVDIELHYDQIVKNSCGTCQRCIKACPTGALKDPHELDANLCLSYQTIENKNSIPSELHGKLSNCLFGCDICQQVCPWNIQSPRANWPEMNPIEEILKMTLSDWENLTEEKFNALFKHSPIKRAGYRKLLDTISILKTRL